VASPVQKHYQRKHRHCRRCLRYVERRCCRISVLTEPKHFKGSLENFFRIRENINAPLLMKTFVLSRVQIDAASTFGATPSYSYKRYLTENYCDSSLSEMNRVRPLPYRLEVLFGDS